MEDGDPNMSDKIGLAFAAAAALSIASPVSAATAFRSLVNDSVDQVVDAYCADCFYYQGEYIEQFSLESASTITGVNLWIYASGGYDVVTSTGYTLNIYDSTRESLLFSQLVLPITTFEARQGIISQELHVGGSTSGLSLSAGTYWAGFEAPKMAIMAFSGGNGTGKSIGKAGYETYERGTNASYQFTSEPTAMPEPASWATMMGGFGLIGGTIRRRRSRVRFA